MHLTNKHFGILVMAIIAQIICACSPIKVLNALVPETNYQLIANVPFGELKRQKLDIYLPKNQPNAVVNLKKVIIFYYGGNWDSGERADYKFAAEALVSLGHIVVVPDYRLYPEVLFPKIMLDPSAAAKWVKLNIGKYGGDSKQVFLVGHSAGAHIAIMLLLDPEYLAIQLLKPNDFVGAIGLAGPYDFLPLQEERFKILFGTEETLWKSQPINFVDGKNPPFLLAVGNKDTLVLPRNTINLANKIKENNGLVEVIQFPSYSHVDMVVKLAKPLRGQGELLDAIATFINKH